MRRDQNKSLRSILSRAGYEDGDSLVVAVSGGPDSLVLLHQLRLLIAPDKLHVAHLDHGIRPNSAGDARYVGELAKEWGLPFHCKRIEVPALARRKKWSLEEAARNARYKFLSTTANAVGATIVAVGHNADDQAETVLLHLLRGSGLTGMRGMQAVSPFPGVPGLTLVRPLLKQKRESIVGYCRRHELEPLIDETNIDSTYLRNRVRLELLPILADYNPRIADQLTQLAEIAAAEEDLAAGLLQEVWPELVVEDGHGWLSLDRVHFQDLPTALQRRAVRRAVEVLSPEVSDLTFKTVEQAVELANRKESGTEAMLPGGLAMLADYETLLFSGANIKRPYRLPQLLADEPVPLPVPGRVRLAGNWVITARPVKQQMGVINPQNDPWLAVVDLPPEAGLFVRTRHTGERMQPLGMDGRSASLQDIMVNRKVAAQLRDNWPLVATDDHVVWLAGHIIDHRARIADNPRRIVRLTCQQIVKDRD